MPTPRKPKKALIQFAVAAVVALVMGAGAIGLTVMIISGMNQSHQAELEKAAAEAKKAKAEAERLKNEIVVEKPKEIVKEVQAIVDIPPGTAINKTMIALVDVDGGRKTLGSFDIETDVIGKVPNARIFAGQTILRSSLMEGDGSVQIKDGLRAMAIQIDPVAGVNGSLTIGSYVDVLTTLTSEDQKITKTLLQGVQVVAVGGAAGSGMHKPGMPSAGGAADTVTLAVTPVQAEMLALAQNQGKFHLTLRNYSDRNVASVTGVDFGQLLTGVDPAGLNKKLPPMPKAKAMPGSAPGEIPVALSGAMSADGGLPQPSGPTPGKRSFTMEVYKGGSSESKTFEMDY